MVALRTPFFSWGRTSTVSDRATAVAFKVGRRAHKKSGGVTPLMKEVMQLYKENEKAD